MSVYTRVSWFCFANHIGASCCICHIEKSICEEGNAYSVFVL